VFKTKINNFVLQGGGDYNLKIYGDPNASFELVVKNETQTKWYNWSKAAAYGELQMSDLENYDGPTHTMPDGTIMPGEFHGDGSLNKLQRVDAHEEQDSFGTGYQSLKGKIGANGSYEFALNIPYSAAESEYHIYFSKEDDSVSQTKYSIAAPIQKLPYIINQLPNTTTTIKMSASANFGNIGGSLVINHAPGVHLNASQVTDGVYRVALTQAAGTGSYDTISIDDEYIDAAGQGLSNGNIINGDGNYTIHTEVGEVNLITFVANNVGKVDGTLALGVAGLRASTIEIQADQIFNLAAE
jgi:hypothetical protein